MVWSRDGEQQIDPPHQTQEGLLRLVGGWGLFLLLLVLGEGTLLLTWRELQGSGQR